MHHLISRSLVGITTPVLQMNYLGFNLLQVT